MRLVVTLLVLGLFVASSAHADEVNLGPVKDNTLYESTDGSLSNGVGEHLFAGMTNQSAGDRLRRSLIDFDLAGSIPPGSTINSVTLTLYMSRTKVNDEVVTLHRVTSDWGEGASDAGGEEGDGDSAEPGDATWQHTFYDTTSWTTAGGDYLASPSASATIPRPEGYYSWSSAGMVTDVAYWLSNPKYGWIIVGNESGSQRTAKRFDSRQNSDLSRRPVLTVDFTPPITPAGSCCLSDDSCIVVTEADCLSMSGTYQGDDTNCISHPCVIITGACCFDDGTCMDLSAADCATASGTYQGDGTDCATTFCPVVLEKFVDPLPIPAVAQPISGQPGEEAYYEMTMTEFQQQLHRDLPPTTVWGYGGSYPGPTIEAGMDKPIFVDWINDLRDSNGDLRTQHYLPVDPCPHGAEDIPKTVVHLHGGHVPPEYDGYPEATYLPGESALYLYENHQLSSTLWYHDHALGQTRLNVYMGLAGFYLIRDPVEQSLDLPSGEYEIPIAIQDRSFNSDGSWAYPSDWQDHFFGDTILVNGKVWPYLEVEKGLYRFRLLNGSNSRTYVLSLSDASSFHQIGTDGGLLRVPVELSELTLAGGERADVVMDFSGYSTGAEILLTNSAPAPYPGSPGVGVVPDIMKFIVTSGSGGGDPLPDELIPVETLKEQDATQFRDFVLRAESDPCTGIRWTINGLLWDDITESVLFDSTEVWSFINRSSVMHPMHVHLVMYQVLDRQQFEVIDDQIVPIGPRIPPPANERGWKDTVRVDPFWIVRVIARFEDYAGLFPYHCHILEHEDHEMMRQFEVLPWRKKELERRRSWQ